MPRISPSFVKTFYEPTDPVRIAGPIHYVGTRGIAAYLITTPAGHILLDGLMPGSEALLEASIRKLGFKPEDIRLLIISHAHVDHVGTLAYFKKLTGASVEVMEADVPLLKSGGTADYLYAREVAFHFPPVVADRALKDGDTASLGGLTLTARHTPGHTRGCTTWVTTVEEDGRPYRVVFAGSTSVNPGTRLVEGPSYAGIAADYRRALDVLASLEPDVFLSGHGGYFDFEKKRARAASAGARAFVDPEGYKRVIAGQRANFEAAVAKEGPLAAPTALPSLGTTRWQLVRFRGGDDTTVVPDDPARYTIEFNTDGTLVARIDCNRGRGTWTSPGPGRLELGPLALTRAMCGPGSLHDRIVKDWGFVRSYLLKDGHLFLSLMADAGTYELEPAPR
jgi:metallo-beta-lactamase class B